LSKDCLLAIVVLYSEKLNTLHNLATPKVVQSFTHAVFGNSGRLPNGICWLQFTTVLKTYPQNPQNILIFRCALSLMCCCHATNKNTILDTRQVAAYQPWVSKQVLSFLP